MRRVSRKTPPSHQEAEACGNSSAPAATVAANTPAAVAAGALLFPQASASWWLGGVFLETRRTGFAGYLANQSLLGMTTRLAGTVPPAAVWLALAVLVGGPALVLAALVHSRGRPVHGWVICAVTGLIISPVSWDHLGVDRPRARGAHRHGGPRPAGPARGVVGGRRARGDHLRGLAEPVARGWRGRSLGPDLVCPCHPG